MAAGLTVYNDNFNVQIDSDYMNIALISTYKIPSVTDPYPPLPSGTPSSPTYTWATKPIFALQPDPINVYQSIYRKAGNGFVHSFEDLPITSTGSGFGLEVYREDGTLSYSSKYKGMVVIDYIKISLQNTGVRDFFSKAYGSTNIAVVPLVVPLGFTPQHQTPMATMWGVSFKLSNTGVLAATMQTIGQIPAGAVGNIDNNYYRLEFLVIDTSNY